MALPGVMFNNDDIICIIKSDRDSGYSFCLVFGFQFSVLDN